MTLPFLVLTTFRVCGFSGGGLEVGGIGVDVGGLGAGMWVGNEVGTNVGSNDDGGGELFGCRLVG